MYGFVQKLQAKSERQKRRLLVTFMAISVVVVGGLWAFSLDRRFHSDDVFIGGALPEEGEEQDTARPLAGPFATLTDTVRGGLASIKDQLGILRGFGDAEEDERAAFPLPTETQ